MSDFNKENTLIPFDQERYDTAISNLAQIEGLIEEAESMIEDGFMSAAQLADLQKTKRGVEKIVRLMSKQKPQVT